jgi:hypothetical protein
MEEWKQITNYPDYFVSNFGNIKRNEKLLKGGKMGAKDKFYIGVSLRNNGKQSSKMVHRLVGEAFIENPDNLPTIDHIDGNKLNNRADNLRWVSYQGNNQNRTKMRTYRNIQTASKYKGVSWNKDKNHWGCKIYINKKAIYLGSSKNEDEAGMLYNKYIDDNGLEFYKKNVILRNPITN